ncbi:hypothetical protein P3T73_05085 [Kiritimatiellota bacterium B12222]|nr:hypothetical protein P3T73_05085 [Kiritimatiellota bacterium B12222]
MKIFILLILLAFSGASAEVVETETWRLFEETVTFTGTAQQDFFAVANDVTLNGVFEDDLWAAGRNVTFAGRSEDDARLMGIEFLEVNGEIDGNLRAITSVGNLLVNTNAVIKGNAVLQGGKRVILKGKIEGDLWIESPTAIIEGEILGDLTLRSRDVQLLPGTIIHGDLLNGNKQDLTIPSGVQLMGENKALSEQREPSALEQNITQLKWMIKGIQFISAYIIGLLMLRVLPRFTGHNVDLLLHHRQPALTAGTIGILVCALSTYLLMISVIGVGVGVFMLLITTLIFYMGKLVVAYALGLIILRQKEDLSFRKLALALFIGLLVLYSAFSLVYIGGALYFMVSCWGMGSILISLRNSQRAIKIQLPPPLKKSQG